MTRVQFPDAEPFLFLFAEQFLETECCAFFVRFYLHRVNFQVSFNILSQNNRPAQSDTDMPPKKVGRMDARNLPSHFADAQREKSDASNNPSSPTVTVR